MNTFPVYNLRDDIYAHNVFAIQQDEDVFSDVYVDTIANVYVEDASWQEEYRAPGLLHKPYMEIRGIVSSVFLAETDQRVFPCGTKKLLLKDIHHTDPLTGEAPDKPQSVTVTYVLSSEELSQVCAMGLFAQANDLSVPNNLIGNIIEIPVPLRYMGVYDTPVAGVEILDAHDLHTCTRESGYYGIFGACERSAEIEAEKHVNFEFYPHVEYENEVAAIYDEPVADYEDQDVRQETAEVEDEFEAAEDETTRSTVQSLVEQHVAQTAAQRAETESHSDSRRAIMERVQGYLDSRQRSKSNEREATLSDAIFGVEGEDTREVDREKATYEDFKEAVLAEESKKSDSTNTSRQTDRAIDNMLMNEGVDDTAGFGGQDSDHTEPTLSETTEDSRRMDRAMDNMLMNEGVDDTAGTTTAQDVSSLGTLSGLAKSGMDILKEKQEQKSGKAQLKSARMADIAADNRALNEGITDIAGQGASSAKKTGNAVPSAKDLLDDLFDAPASAPAEPADTQHSDDEQQFL